MNEKERNKVKRHRAKNYSTERYVIEDSILSILFNYLINENEELRHTIEKLKDVEWSKNKNGLGSYYN